MGYQTKKFAYIFYTFFFRNIKGTKGFQSKLIVHCVFQTDFIFDAFP